jgi:hypothetical protein
MKALTNIFKDCVQGELDKKQTKVKKRVSLGCKKNISKASKASSTRNQSKLTQSSILRKTLRGDGSTRSTVSFSNKQVAPGQKSNQFSNSMSTESIQLIRPEKVMKRLAMTKMHSQKERKESQFANPPRVEIMSDSPSNRDAQRSHSNSLNYQEMTQV